MPNAGGRVYGEQIESAILYGKVPPEGLIGHRTGQASPVVREIDEAIKVIDDDLRGETYGGVLLLTEDSTLDEIGLTDADPSGHCLIEFQTKTCQVSHHSLPLTCSCCLFTLRDWSWLKNSELLETVLGNTCLSLAF
jgi:hypothetical protein